MNEDRRHKEELEDQEIYRKGYNAGVESGTLNAVKTAIVLFNKDDILDKIQNGSSIEEICKITDLSVDKIMEIIEKYGEE